MKTVVALFESTRAAIRAERACRAAGIKCQAIPVPRTVSAGCGIALEISNEDRGAAEVELAKAGIISRMVVQG